MTKYWLLMPPTDAKYCAIYDNPEFDDFGMPMEGEPIGKDYSRVDFKMAREVKGKVVPDVIMNVLGYLMVSDRAKELIGANEAAAAPIEFLPFRLIDHKKGVAADSCWIVNVIGTVDCADTANIRGLRDPGRSGTYFQVTKLPIIPGKVPDDRNIFRASQFPPQIVIRDDLKQIFEKATLTARYVVPGDAM